VPIHLEQATVLLVDDEPALLDIIGKWLLLEGCGQVLKAPDGEAAFAMLESSHVDLLITDVHMPRVDGVSLVRRLVDRKLPLPSIIFVSGFGEVDRREMYGLGVEAFLAKPFRREELLAAIRRALAERTELWRDAMPIPPRQTMCLDASLAAFQLGRGGFSAHHPGPLSLSKVAFNCPVDEDQRVLSGEGFVRWYSRADHTVGVEFFYLDPECHAWVAEAIRAANPRGFIPRFPIG